MATNELYITIDEAHKVQTNMERYGGSFTKALAQAILHADCDNLRKIKKTWADLWQHFLCDYDKYNQSNNSNDKE